jgi:hypothetical protein
MGLFDFWKKEEKVLDLSEKYRKQQEQLSQATNESKQEKQEFVPLFNTEENSPNENSPNNIEEHRRKLKQKLSDMTIQLENLSKQVYQLQQRVEVLEMKTRN